MHQAHHSLVIGPVELSRNSSFFHPRAIYYDTTNGGVASEPIPRGKDIRWREFKLQAWERSRRPHGTLPFPPTCRCSTLLKTTSGTKHTCHPHCGRQLRFDKEHDDVGRSTKSTSENAFPFNTSSAGYNERAPQMRSPAAGSQAPSSGPDVVRVSEAA
ncbi:hypothetical protein BC628DRAFT_977881 [Trametes gibbosa]|nr:hypothetical protein BC628DRAFT_977881 [Trametes gibbosa]